MKKATRQTNTIPDTTILNSKPAGKRKLIITGAVTAAVACAVCLVPAAFFIVMGGGMLALFSTWLGQTTAAIAVLVGSIAVGLWFYKRPARKCGCSGGT